MLTLSLNTTIGISIMSIRQSVLRSQNIIGYLLLDVNEDLVEISLTTQILIYDHNGQSHYMTNSLCNILKLPKLSDIYQIQRNAQPQ